MEKDLIYKEVKLLELLNWMTRGKQELIAEGFDYKDSEKRGPQNELGGRKKAKTKRSAILRKFR